MQRYEPAIMIGPLSMTSSITRNQDLGFDKDRNEKIPNNKAIQDNITALIQANPIIAKIGIPHT